MAWVNSLLVKPLPENAKIAELWNAVGGLNQNQIAFDAAHNIGLAGSTDGAVGLYHFVNVNAVVC